MKVTREAEPLSCPRASLFMVGQDSHGNWVVQDQSGARGGLFVGRAEALRFVRFEAGNRSPAVVTVGGVLELDMTRSSDRSKQRRFADPLLQRRVA
jgi:hypothetical protein